MLDAYPPIPPKQVTVSCVHLTSYGFLQTPPLASDALAIRIVFPLSQGDSTFFQVDGFASFAGQTTKAFSLKCYGEQAWHEALIFAASKRAELTGESSTSHLARRFLT